MKTEISRSGMETRRRKLKKAVDKENPEQLHLLTGQNTCGFDLAPADLSSDGSESDSSQRSLSCRVDSDDGATCKNLCNQSQTSLHRNQSKIRTHRVIDSLDLSMSVTELEDVLRDADGSNTKKRSICTNQTDGGSQPESVKQDTHTVSGVQLQHSAVSKISRIPKLVQQRRMLLADSHHSSLSSYTQNSFQTPFTEVSYRVLGGSKGQRKDDLPTNNPSAPKLNPIAKSTEHSEHRPEAENMTEDTDFTATEEKRIIQALERLDQRLSSVTASAVAVRECSHHDPNTTTGLGLLNNEENTRTTSYTGDTQCKIPRSASKLVRLSSTKRAELSSGIYKSRVRAGGAHVSNTHHYSSTDGLGKHKIVVKKELTHLLF